MKENINILVVDDEIEILKFFERLLAMKGLGVSVTPKGEEALKLLSSNPIDVVITDIIMPEMDGFELTKAIKQKYPHMAVIMMTGRGDAEMVRKATLCGADEYITKPFDREELSLVIERATWKIMTKETISDNI